MAKLMAVLLTLLLLVNPGQRRPRALKLGQHPTRNRYPPWSCHRGQHRNRGPDEYTVIGDTVNVASRIQDACKSVGEALLISDVVKTRLPPDIQVRSLPEQQVKGRQAPVQIYAVNEQESSD